MPLHAGDPVSRAGPFDGLNNSIRRMSGNAQTFGEIEERLMMRAVDVGFGDAPAEFGQPRIRFDARRVKWLGISGNSVAPLMLDRRFIFARDILNQRAAEENVHALHAVANSQHGFVLGKSVAQDGEIGLLARGVSRRGFFIARGVIELRIDVRRAAGKYVGVERFDKLRELVFRQIQRDFDGFAAGQTDGFEILVVAVPLIRKLFIQSAIRDTDAWSTVCSGGVSGRFVWTGGGHGKPILSLWQGARQLDAGGPRRALFRSA